MQNLQNLLRGAQIHLETWQWLSSRRTRTSAFPRQGCPARAAANFWHICRCLLALKPQPRAPQIQGADERGER